MAKLKKRNNFLKFLKKNQKVLAIVLIALIGVSLLVLTKASGFNVSVEPEKDTLAGCATQESDNSASGGQFVKFGCSSGTVSNDLTIITPRSELDALKVAVKSGEKKKYWDYVKSKTYISDPSRTAWAVPDWSKNLTYSASTGTYSFNPKTFIATDHPDSRSATAQSEFMTNSALAAYTSALRWRFDDDQVNGNHAMNIINSWVNNFEKAECRSSGIDGRENQVKLGSGWMLGPFTKAVEIMWDSPDFTPAKKQAVADWLWRVFLLSDARYQQKDFEILGGNGSGWNGRTLYLQARTNIGLIMKAAGHPKASEVISATINGLDDTIPEILYYGKAPWHEKLGQPWPKQPYTYNGANPYYATSTRMIDYWFFTSDVTSPPPFFVGQTQETGRDMGHNQLGMGSLSETFRALRLNGYGDRYSAQSLGAIMLGLGERHARFYNEALDEVWSKGYSSPDQLSSTWQPSEWSNLKLSSDKSTKTSFKVKGDGADHGWEVIRTELKRSGYDTPQLDRLVLRLRGNGSPRNANSTAGFKALTTANQNAWEPLFSLDYK